MTDSDSRQANELNYVLGTLVPEFKERFTYWNTEYSTQERDLGVKAEFVELWRKAKKIKAIVWDGADERDFREGLRTILFEIIAHAFLLLYDWDRTSGERLQERQDKVRQGKWIAVPGSFDSCETPHTISEMDVTWRGHPAGPHLHFHWNPDA